MWRSGILMLQWWIFLNIILLSTEDSQSCTVSMINNQVSPMEPINTNVVEGDNVTVCCYANSTSYKHNMTMDWYLLRKEKKISSDDWDDDKYKYLLAGGVTVIKNKMTTKKDGPCKNIQYQEMCLFLPNASVSDSGTFTCKSTFDGEYWPVVYNISIVVKTSSVEEITKSLNLSALCVFVLSPETAPLAEIGLALRLVVSAAKHRGRALFVMDPSRDRVHRALLFASSTSSDECARTCEEIHQMASAPHRWAWRGWRNSCSRSRFWRRRMIGWIAYHALKQPLP